MGEGYRNIKPAELPAGTEFVSRPKKIGSKLAAFSTDWSDWGAAYRRVTDLKTGHVQFSRYYNTPDERVAEEDDE